MKQKIKEIRGIIISGIIFFVPLFVLLVILQNILGFMHGFGKELAKLLGINTIAGISTASILTTIILLVIFYLCGKLVHYTFITRAMEWLEESVLNYVPNYSKYKAKMMVKLQPKEDERKPALVGLNDHWKPCLIVSTSDDKTTVFIPTTPDTDYGEVMVVDSVKVKTIEMDVKAFKSSLLLAGKGLKLN